MLQCRHDNVYSFSECFRSVLGGWLGTVCELDSTNFIVPLLSSTACDYGDFRISAAKVADVTLRCIDTTLCPGTSTTNHRLFGRTSVQGGGQMDR
jgi:hypothetical protein